MSQFVTCAPTGGMLGRQRYPNLREAPEVKAWRCELTGLSQLYNLYFVACDDVIYVHQPSFPNQSLSSEPELILHLPISSPNLEHYIDEDNSHSINRLLVDFLGNDEILLATCDDGDVVGFRVDEIQRAIYARHGSSIKEPNHLYAGEIKTFLHRNVGLSAWGLAVHKEARMIAISANTHQVTVLAYALANEETNSPELGFSDAMPNMDDTEANDFPFPRRRDHVITLRAKNNLPAVSFNNTSQDVSGRWLFSSCINGETILWDLHQPTEPARTFQMGWCVSTQSPAEAPKMPLGRCSCRNSESFLHSAWGAMFLDAHSAHETTSLDEHTPKYAHVAPYFDYAHSQKVEFITDEASFEHSFGVDHGDASSDGASEMIMSESDSEDSNGTTADDDQAAMNIEPYPTGEEAESDQDDEMEQDEPETQGGNPQYTGPPIPPMQTSPNTSSPFQHNLPASLAIQSLLPQTIILSIDEAAQILHNINGEDGDSDDDTDDDNDNENDNEGWLDAFLLNTRMMSSRTHPYCEISTRPAFQSEHSYFPCIIITKNDIFLLQRPLYSTTNTDPILVLRNPLHPQLDGNQGVASYDRICFCTQIPELGIFIVASPVGRAAIFALVKSTESGTYGFKLEYILPFDKDNENSVVQVAREKRLVGVAVGPVQGMFGGRDGLRERRWRLLMYFTDHTTVGWEITRKRGGRDVGLAELVV